MLMISAARAAEPIRPSYILQGSFTFFLGDVEQLEFRYGEAFQDHDRAARNDLIVIFPPVCGIDILPTDCVGSSSHLF